MSRSGLTRDQSWRDEAVSRWQPKALLASRFQNWSLHLSQRRPWVLILHWHWPVVLLQLYRLFGSVPSWEQSQAEEEMAALKRGLHLSRQAKFQKARHTYECTTCHKGRLHGRKPHFLLDVNISQGIKWKFGVCQENKNLPPEYEHIELTFDGCSIKSCKSKRAGELINWEMEMEHAEAILMNPVFRPAAITLKCTKTTVHMTNRVLILKSFNEGEHWRSTVVKWD